MNVLMLGNGFDLYHYFFSSYDNFMTIGEYLRKKYCIINYAELEKINVYSELYDLATKNEEIKNKLLTYKEAYKKVKINKDEYVDFLEKLHSNCWFQYFLDIKSRNGWVALENEVATVLEHFRETNTACLSRFVEAIKEKNNYTDAVFKHIKKYSIGNKESDEYFFQEYTQFVKILKLYLKIFVNSILSDISSLYSSYNDHFKNKDYILTFNYTDTYAKLYDSTAKMIHIHGNLDDEIVVGVNSDEYDNVANNDCKYIKYKKYYQRITKHTLEDLRNLINHAESTKKTKELFVVGHSLDVSDGDIITVIFELFDSVTVYFHEDEVLESHVKNLKFIFGAKELNKMTFSQKIIFQKLPQNEFKRCVYDQL